MKFGLPETVIENIIKVFQLESNVESVILFGSRAKGNYKNGSDIDIAIKGSKLSFDNLLTLNQKLDELNLPYIIDLIDFRSIKERDLIEHINRVGIVIYSKKEYA